MKSNMVNWFEIPVTNMDRAVKFYSTVFNVELQVQKFGEELMAWFPHEEAGGAGGALNYHTDPEIYKPSTQGTLVYFSSRTDDVNDELNRIEAQGGKILQAKTQISPEIGYMALFLDTEGNKVALHSRK